jgi:histidine ammonia-lyase
MSEGGHGTVMLDGSSLDVVDLVRVARDPALKVACSPEAMQRVGACRAHIDSIVDAYKRQYAVFQRTGAAADRPAMTYGVTTGFGLFKHIPIAPDELEETQRRLLRSHCVGVGENSDEDDPANYFAPEVVRAALVLRVNAFLKGHSGVRPELVETVVAMINRGIIPLVPIRGSLGASGDLCPLSHLFVVLVGEGRFYVVRSAEEMRCGSRGYQGAAALGQALGREAAMPVYKEGLALINGTNFSTALLAMAVRDAELLADTADTAAAMSLEAVCGRARAFDPVVHAARGHAGQVASAARIRGLIEGSRLIDRAADVQDVYSLRCAPQVHGASRDAIAYARGVVEREINAATDNPLFFPKAEAWDAAFAANRPDGQANGSAFSAGNFHGQPVALAADFLAIAVAELASISERRVQMLLDANHNRNLPANLIANRGVNSGYMIAQYSAASMVSENKVLAHPASVDSIPTSANSEDHVPMSLIAGRKLRTVLGNAQSVLAIELMVAAQAIEWRAGMGRDPNGAGRRHSRRP